MPIQIYRGTAEHILLPLTQGVNFNQEIMGDKSIVFEIEVPSVVNIQIGDYMLYRGERYTLNYVPNYDKISSIRHRYRLKFESEVYTLYNKLFTYDGEAEFPYTATASEFIQLLVSQINMVDTGWTVGTIESSDTRTINFDGASCRVALTTIAEEFGLEWNVVSKRIDLVQQVGQMTTLSLAYGKGNGLYNIQRQTVDNSGLVTRMYGYGGTRNLPASFSGSRLTLPERYLQANTDLYGIIEGQYKNDDIFPRRESTITAISTINADTRSFTIRDTTLDFDINQYLLEGVTAKVVFNSGLNIGYEFEITRYDHATRTITLNSDISETDYVMPNPTLKPAVGDKYVLIDISMPQSYVNAAVAELRSATQANLDENKVPRVAYTFNSDVLNMKQEGWMLNPGDIVNIVDAGINLNANVRVYAVSYPLDFTLQDRLEPGTVFNAVLSDSVPYTTQERVIKDTIDNQREISVVDRRDYERARRNAMQLRQLRDYLVDPDGYFDTTRLKPASIETLYLSVGAKSQNFGLNGVDIDANTMGNPNHLTISAGALVHYEVEIPGLGYIWQLPAASFPSLTPSAAYYVAARCSRTSLVGDNQWVISQSPMMTESQPGYWLFNIGILYPVSEGFRNFDFTNGMTYVIGDQITTGRIKSLDGLSFFDLTQDTFNLGDEESGIDFGVTAPGTLTIRGAVASSTVTVGSGGFVSAGLSGVTDNGDESVRFWAGADVENKNAALFRVLNNGFVFARNLRLGQGADSNGWNVSPTGIISDPLPGAPDNFGLIRAARKAVGDPQRTEFSFGTELIPASAGGQLSLTGRIANRNLLPSDVPGIRHRNTALELTAAGADDNIALDLAAGGVRVSGDNGINFDNMAIATWDGSQYRGRIYKFKNGILVDSFWDPNAT